MLAPEASEEIFLLFLASWIAAGVIFITNLAERGAPEKQTKKSPPENTPRDNEPPPAQAKGELSWDVTIFLNNHHHSHTCQGIP